MIIDLLVFNIIHIICLDISKAVSKFCTYSYHVQRFVYQEILGKSKKSDMQF